MIIFSSMRLFYLIWSFGIAASGLQVTAASAPVDAVAEITVSSQHAAVKAGESIRIIVVTRQLVDGLVFYNDSNGYLRFSATRDGKPVRETEYAQQKRAYERAFKGGVHGSALEKENPEKQEVLISRWFDMSIAGTYQVTVERNLSAFGGSQAIRSNEISIEVTEP